MAGQRLQALKGQDRAAADLLVGAVPAAGLDVHLATFSKHDIGSGGDWD